jgi:hypothetical protein
MGTQPRCIRYRRASRHGDRAVSGWGVISFSNGLFQRISEKGGNDGRLRIHALELGQHEGYS